MSILVEFTLVDVNGSYSPELSLEDSAAGTAADCSRSASR